MGYNFEHKLFAVNRYGHNVVNTYSVGLDPTTELYVSRGSSLFNSVAIKRPPDFDLVGFLELAEEVYETAEEAGHSFDDELELQITKTSGECLGGDFERPLTVSELTDNDLPPDIIGKIRLSSPLGAFFYDNDLTGALFREKPLQIHFAMAYLVKIVPVDLDPQELTRYIFTLEQPKPPRFEFDPPV